VQLPEPMRFSEKWERAGSFGLREGRVSVLADNAEHGRIRVGALRKLVQVGISASAQVHWLPWRPGRFDKQGQAGRPAAGYLCWGF
jgi:hypothetical protein